MILSPTPGNIKKAAELLRSGEVVAFPTETVYGLGADACRDSAVKKIFDLKNRPASNPLIVHVAKVEQALELMDTSASEQLIARFKKLSILWPGPLSLIVPKKDQISDLVSAGGKTIAIRIPNHPVALKILEEAKIPIAAPSANKSFAVSPTTAQHVQDSFLTEDLKIIDGGGCTVGLESTVLDISGEAVQVLRPGAISCKQIAKILGEECLDPSLKTVSVKTETLRSPGLLDLHYSPATSLVFIEDLAQIKPSSKMGVILFSEEHKQRFATSSNHVVILSRDADLEEVARSLYREIRALDQLGLDLIVVDNCLEDDIGAAIMDRLRRARRLPG